MRKSPSRGDQNPLAIDPGKLRNRILIQQRTSTLDGYGEPIDTWTNVAPVWAAISTVSSKEVYQASQFTSQVTHTVKIRWSSSLTIAAGMRVVFEDRIFVIQAIENMEERNRILNLMCLEIDGVTP